MIELLKIGNFWKG